MKNIVIFFMALGLFTSNLQAQIRFVTKDTSAIADIYAGYIGGSAATVNEKTHSVWNTSIRTGVNVEHALSKALKIRGFGIAEYSKFFGKERITTFGNAFVEYDNKNLMVQAGKIAGSIAGNYRPYPVSLFGQFEFVSESVLPGAGLGIRSSIQFGKMNFETSVLKRDTTGELQISLGSKVLKVGGFYTTGKYGGVITFEKGKVTLQFSDQVINKMNTFGAKIVIGIGKDNFVFNDTVLRKGRFDWLQFGGGKKISFQKLTGVIVLSGIYTDNSPERVQILFALGL